MTIINSLKLRATRSCPDCDLRGADLQRKNLKEADLRGAKLGSASLIGADLNKANLEGAKMCNTTMPVGTIDNSGC